MIEQLREVFGTAIGENEPYLTGKPREYYCEEHGVIMGAVVYDPYDCPEYICAECGEKLSYNKLEE